MRVLSCVACMCVSVSSMLVSEIITDLVASTFGICLVSTWRGPLQATDTYCREVMRGFFFFLALMIPTYFRPFPHLGFGRAWDLPRWASRWGK